MNHHGPTNEIAGSLRIILSVYIYIYINEFNLASSMAPTKGCVHKWARVFGSDAESGFKSNTYPVIGVCFAKGNLAYRGNWLYSYIRSFAQN